MADNFRLDGVSSPGERFKLGNKLCSGVWGILYEAVDNNSGKKVAVKVTNLNKNSVQEVQDELKVYKALESHENVAKFHGIYKKQGRADIQQAWVVTELFEGGTVADYVQAVHRQNKRLPEEHIAFILRELIKGIIHLHESNVIHRNVRADSVMLTQDGRAKLSNLSYASRVDSPEAKLQVCIGPPNWLAPEVAICENQEHEGYDLRADVWAIGITAIELGDGRCPLQDTHPAPALFQIVRNPPPTLFRPANWSQLYNDFITECLEKNPENRPHAQELIEHPFFEIIFEKEKKIQQEISMVLKSQLSLAKPEKSRADTLVRGQYWEKEHQGTQRLLQEDLAALEKLTEDSILDELQMRADQKEFYTFAGDVLLAINPNKDQEIYGNKYHVKYQFKARSENAPHIYTVADKAYQDVMHNEEPQNILVAGEAMSGKTTNMNYVIDHLLYLGKGNTCVELIRTGLRVIRAMGTAETSQNLNSTRHLLQTQLTFTSTGKVSGAIFWLYLLEKTRVSALDKKNANFHLFYYFYDKLEADGTLPEWNLETGRDYRFLRTSDSILNKQSVRGNPAENPKKWQQFEDDLQSLEIPYDYIQSIKKVLAAVLLLGEVDFGTDSDGKATIDNSTVVETVAKVLDVDTKKFSWALLNYCVVEKGEATKRRHSVQEASDARDVLAQGLYSRLVDLIVCKINEKLSVCRALFGDRHYISVTDLFGFECFARNTLEQLFVNSVNEQLQFHYNQRVFVWEMQDGEEEEIPVPPLPFYDNKPAVDQLLSKPDGLMFILDDASRGGGISHIMEKLREKPSHISAKSGGEFTVAHYTGRITYDATDFPDKNRDFLPPEMIETLRQSEQSMVQLLFTALFSKSGNLTVAMTQEIIKKSQGRWGAALTAEHENRRARKYNTESRGQYSQSRQMRTAAATFRGACLELLRSLSGSCGVHFVRCIRANLGDKPETIQADLVRQQLKALAVLDTTRARQKGYSTRIAFSEFLRRYQFLAFDFDEQVDITKDNCRLLLIRLKMEGWVIGKTKVFLKYYNEEYLSRLYETQVKKIVKVQSMMRAFLAKRNIAGKLEKLKSGNNSFCESETGDVDKIEPIAEIQEEEQGNDEVMQTEEDEGEEGGYAAEEEEEEEEEE